MTRRMLYLPALIVAGVLVACAVAVLALSEKAEANLPGKNGRIAFVSTRDTKNYPESGDIYTMYPNGTAVHRLTNHPERDFEPAWSPHGRKIAFMSFRSTSNGAGSTYRLLTMNARGTRVEPLNSNPHDDHDPAWSPDGNRIAFVRDLHGKKPCRMLFSCNEIYTINADGTGLERLTNNRVADSDPDW